MKRACQSHLSSRSGRRAAQGATLSRASTANGEPTGSRDAGQALGLVSPPRRRRPAEATRSPAPGAGRKPSASTRTASSSRPSPASAANAGADVERLADRGRGHGSGPRSAPGCRPAAQSLETRRSPRSACRSRAGRRTVRPGGGRSTGRPLDTAQQPGACLDGRRLEQIRQIEVEQAETDAEPCQRAAIGLAQILDQALRLRAPQGAELPRPSGRRCPAPAPPKPGRRARPLERAGGLPAAGRPTPRASARGVA